MAIVALLLPLELRALTPLLSWAYADGTPGGLFPLIRLLSCLIMIFVPAVALGATFPMAIRWFASTSTNPAGPTGALYTVNTVGAAVGALLAGFILIPTIGLSGATRLGVGLTSVAALSVLLLARSDRRDDESAEADQPPPRRVAVRPDQSSVVWRFATRTARRSAEALRAKAEASALRTRSTRTRDTTTRAKRSKRSAAERPTHDDTIPWEHGRWLAVVILGVSGFASLMHEIVWTRILALVLGPTTYAFAATLAAVIAGAACGSAIGTWLVRRSRRHGAMWLAFALAGAALTTTYTSWLAGQYIPRTVAEQIAGAPGVLEQLVRQGALLTTSLILPTSLCLGAAFPLTLSIVGDASPQIARRFGAVYAVNTIGAVSGSLAAGFLFIPLIGLQGSLRLVSVCLIAAALVVVVLAALSRLARIAGWVAAVAAVAMLALSPPWDRELLASGAYLYAPFVPKDLSLETLLKAGTLLYYREGAASTVSVKRLTGTTTLAVDGKVDASNRGDMLTQKLIAHLPLLLHDNPRDVAIVGLGSGATAGSALRHPIARADVIEISPEVVEASRFFIAENHRALDDPRTRLIVGDGRSHLLLSRQRYDVIISEPSNPWIAGVAALFTREFFLAARDRLNPGGLICQWANAYNISERDLRSIVATFRSVFPDGTAWLVGGDDVLLLASTDPIEPRLSNVARHWTRPGVAEDLARVSVPEPFSLLSLFVGGPVELTRYGESAEILTDDRMALEFSAPRELHNRRAGENGATLSALLGDDEGPAVIKEAFATAGVAQWRNRGAMMAKSDAVSVAYDDYVRALTLDPRDAAALDGLVRTAVLASRAGDALSWVKGLTVGRPATAEVLVATSKLLAATGQSTDAIRAATDASRLDPVPPLALEQLASLFADAGDTTRLDATLTTLQRIAPDRAATHYYAAVSAFLHDRPADAVTLAQRAIAIDPEYASVYDLIGAAHTKLAQPQEAYRAFETSLTFDAHDSTAYTNLGLLELASGNGPAAARYFAEALWLAPQSTTAREGLARADPSRSR